MAKKKKANHVSNISNSGRIGSEGVHILVEEFLELRLLAHAKAVKGQPEIFLESDDARRIDVLQGDEVIVLVHDNGSITGAAICSASVSIHLETTRHLGSPPTPKASRFSPGSCHVSPTWLAVKLCGRCEEAHIGIPKGTDVAVTTPMSTPSKGFSFARGGGGDILISPSSQKKESLTPRSPSRLPTRVVWVVPLQSTFGEKLAKVICQRAACLELRSVTEYLPDSIKIIQRLVLANYSGRYISDNDSVSISYQGKPLLFQVTAIRATDSHSDLVSSMESLSLNDDLSNVSTILNSIRSATSQMDLTLYQIIHETKVFMRNPDKLTPDTTTTEDKHFVAGLDSTIEQVKDLLLPSLINPGVYGNLKAPRGALLHGPSGVGKSATAEEIAHIFSGKHNLKVEKIHCASLQSHTSMVGEAERRLTRLFQQSQDTLLIFDDIHLICPKRSGSNPGGDRLAATLLSLLDGIGQEKTANIVILAITSNASLLDPALRRPGRLDAEIEVPIPDEIARKEIIAFLLANVDSRIQIPEFSGSEMMSLSHLAKGFNGADCKLAIKEAVRIAARSIPNTTDILELSIDQLKTSISMTKPSTISSVTVEIPEVHWTSIGGMDSVKEKLREAIELPITHSHLFEALHIPPPRGVLLYGPPGCSKTLMARALATEGQMNFLAVKGPELLSKWLGESERALASLFRRARMASPCIVFFDEVDAIAAKRGGGEGSAGGERLLSQLLTELDGINSPAGNKVEGTKPPRVIVVGATNRPDLLDTALTRPGRIDRMIYVGLPDVHSRNRIFEIGLKGKACHIDIDFSLLASESVSGGFSGAEIIAICREAALLAIEEYDESPTKASSLAISMKHLMQAVVTMQRQISPEMLDFYAQYARSITATAQ